MRDHDLDTSKACLIFLVVFGHFVERLIGWTQPESYMLLASIYFFHMPAFIFISGMLFKDRNYLKNILFFLSLYLPFQVLFAAYNWIWTDQFVLSWNLFKWPYWILWYLMGMMVWTLLTHHFIKFKIPPLLMLGIAIAGSIGIGYSTWNNYYYSFGRILVFFPFFMLGHLYGQKVLQNIRQQKHASIYAIVILASILALVSYTHISQYWLYGSVSFKQMGIPFFDGTWIRLGCLIISLLGIYALFALTTRLKHRCLRLGENTLPVYLLHGFAVIGLSHYLNLKIQPIWGILICLGLSILTCWILQQSIFDRALRKLSQWLMKPTEKLWKRPN